MTFEEAISFMKTSAWQGSIPGLERLSALLDVMGNPENRVPAIHIAGTNGKGSVSRMLEQALANEGYRVGAFTSPYLVRITEQIRYNGREITQEEFAYAMSEVKQACTQTEKLPTEFELVTAAAFVYFLYMKCDIVILEAGMGGELDATNVIETSLVSVFCSIGLDHTAFLGNTTEEIARTKSGIIKKGGAVVTCEQKTEVEQILRDKCRLMGVDIETAKESEVILKDAGSLKHPVQRIAYKGNEMYLGLLGSYQRKNVSIVLKTLEVLSRKGFPVSFEMIYRSLGEVRWPGRFEVLCTSPYVILDGAHNVQGVEALVESFDEYLCGKKVVLVTGVMKDKDYDSMYDLIDPYVEAYFAVRPDNERALSAELLAEFLRKYGKPIFVLEAPSQGMKAAIAYANEKENSIIAAVGSLYMAGEIRGFLGKNYIF